MGTVLLELPAWIDLIGPEWTRKIEAEVYASGPPTGRLLPHDHGARLEEHLAVGLRAFLAAKDPFYFVRIGDCELLALSGGYRVREQNASLPDCLRLSGFRREDFPRRRELFEAFRDASLLGVQENWASVRDNTEMVFRLLGLPVPHPRAVDCHILYKALVDGTLFRWLSGRKVALVGALAPKLEGLWKTPWFHEVYRHFGPVDQVRIVGAVATRRREEGGVLPELDSVMARLSGIDYDTALVACGAPAKMLCRRIWLSGKTALDAGFVFDALIGDGERWQRPCLKDAAWPHPFV